MNTMAHTTINNAASLQPELVEASAQLMPTATIAAALTATEHAVLHLLATGRSNAQIGQCLGRSSKTVRNQLTRVYAKLGVINRAEAVAVHMRMEFRRGRQGAS